MLITITITSDDQNGSTLSTNQPVQESLHITGINISGINILLCLIYGAIIAIMIGIAIKRLFRRRQLIIKFPHKQNPPGSGGTEKLRNKINEGLDEVAQFEYEPVLLCADDAQPTDENLISDYYRMKTVDEIYYVDQAFANFDPDLKRPMGKDVCQHLRDVKSHSSGCLKSIRTNQITTVSEIYTHARYGQEVFTLQHYSRFKELTSHIISAVRQRKTSKKSKELPSDSVGIRTTALPTWLRSENQSNSSSRDDSSKPTASDSLSWRLYGVEESGAVDSRPKNDADPLLGAP